MADAKRVHTDRPQGKQEDVEDVQLRLLYSMQELTHEHGLRHPDGYCLEFNGDHADRVTITWSAPEDDPVEVGRVDCSEMTAEVDVVETDTPDKEELAQELNRIGFEVG